jgi:Fe-S cluster biogenesis protein NfuA
MTQQVEYERNNRQASKGGIAVKERVEEALAKVRPFLQRDGGDVQLVEITEDNVVKVKLKGACHG